MCVCVIPASLRSCRLDLEWSSSGSLVVVVVVSASALGIGTLLSYRDFDPLCGEALAQSRALADTRELLSREDLEDIAKDGRQDRRFTSVDGRVAIYRAIRRLHTHVDKRKSEPIRSGSASGCTYSPKDRRQNLPEQPLGSDAEILQDEPYANFIIRIAEPEGTGCQAPDQISSKHATGLPAADGYALAHPIRLLVTTKATGLRGHVRHGGLKVRPEIMLREVLIRRRKACVSYLPSRTQSVHRDLSSSRTGRREGAWGGKSECT